MKLPAHDTTLDDGPAVGTVAAEHDAVALPAALLVLATHHCSWLEGGILRRKSYGD